MSDTTLLTLEVVEFKNMADWVWRLKNSRGRVLGEYAVKLKKEAPEYAAFRDLYAYLRANVAPDNSADDERRLLSEVGAWIGREVLGPIAHLIINDYGVSDIAERLPSSNSRCDQADIGRRDKAPNPTVVRVMVPLKQNPNSGDEDPSALLYRPIELPHVNGKPLALQEVSFVFELGEIGSRAPWRRHSGPLRMLAVFSLQAAQARSRCDRNASSFSGWSDILPRRARWNCTYSNLERHLKSWSASSRMAREGYSPLCRARACVGFGFGNKPMGVGA